MDYSDNSLNNLLSRNQKIEQNTQNEKENRIINSRPKSPVFNVKTERYFSYITWTRTK